MRRPALLVAALAFAALVAVSAARAGLPAPVPAPVPAPAPAPAPETPRPNILLITLDTTRADHLGCYGWTHARTPNLDALAHRGTLFERCDTAAPITLTSHATILTGLFPPRHGVRDNGTFILPARVETAATRLRAAGYDTAAVVSAVVLARRYGLDRGFRIYDDDLGPASATRTGTGTEASERTAQATTAAALAVLAKLRPPFFLWVHYFDPHEEYRPPERIARSMGGPHPLYDGEIAFADEQIGALLAVLPSSTDVVAVGDHGEMLGEHGEPTHGLLLYAGARRVPLILAGPDVPAARRVPCLVRTADVTPTLLAWGRVTATERLDGEPLLPLPSASDCGRVSYTESFLPFFAYRWYPPRALSDGRELFLRSPGASLYAIAEDPSETHDAAAAKPGVAREWERRLDDLLAAAGERPDAEGAVSAQTPASAEDARRLLSLGYLGGGGGLDGPDPKLPDSRGMTGIARDLHEATRQMQQDRFAEALPSLESVLRRDPRNFTALTLAARCLQETGQCAEALPLFRRASQENPRSEVPVVDSAGCLLALGRRDEAMDEFRRALALDPTQPESAAGLARLLAAAGDRAAALQVLDGALSAGSHAPGVFLEHGTILAQSGRLSDAYASFREASRRNPDDPVALENAARAAYQLGRPAESASLYEELVKRTPTSEAWRTLGAIYLSKLDDRANGLRCFREALRLELDPAIREEIRRIIGGLEE
ncbi:MAG TPA: sulfatase-like hydrolase/transferase [Thermoanaerobaculia bacterium]